MSIDKSLNGIECPIFQFHTKLYNLFVKEIELDLTGVGGLTIENIELKKTKVMKDYSVRDYRQGWHLQFTLDYTAYSDNTNTGKIIEILNAFSIYNVNIIPRSDCRYNNYEIVFSGGKITTGITPDTQGTRGIQLVFQTKHLLPELKYYDISFTTICTDDEICTNKVSY